MSEVEVHAILNVRHEMGKRCKTDLEMNVLKEYDS